MRHLLNPRWILIINTFPVAVLLFLFAGEYKIINSLLEEESIQLWKVFGFALGVLGLVNLGYVIYLIFKKKSTSVWYGVLALLCYIPFIYLYGFYYDKIVPFDIPRWMVQEDIFIYVGTFLMPTLIYSIIILVIHFTPQASSNKAWKSFAFAVAIPVVWYLSSQIILPLWRPVENGFNTHVAIVLLITGTLIFLFFLVRGVFIVATKKGAIWSKYQLVWKIPISVILPLIGLALNNGHSLHDFSSDNLSVFGNFSNIWFYILALLNGLLICLPNVNDKLYRLILFVGRSTTFAYTFYFFLVFLPFLPLSVIAIVAAGVGFLMLTPLVLFVIHVSELSKDFSYLSAYFSKNTIWGLSILGFCIIPLVITVKYMKDKSTINQALDYLYSPDYTKPYEIDKASLYKTIEVVKNHKSRLRGSIFDNKTPYLSSYFNWIVLDNLTLSHSKIGMIQEVFFGGGNYSQSDTDNLSSDGVEITHISTSSSYDESQQVWRSWVDLEIANHSGNTWFSEYATTFDLPEGCWISDYYLYVEGKKEMGILAEKKSAMWVFSQIRNENRDPGILHYLTGNKISFRIFPFTQDEVRKTGVEFLHREPLKIEIEGHSIELGKEPLITTDTSFENENIAYISTKRKQTLKQVERKPYFHFLVDVSREMEGYSEEFVRRIEHLCNQYKEQTENAKVSFVNTYVKTIPLEDNWQQIFKEQPFEGGFYLDRAIKMTLINAHKSKEPVYPVLVVLTDNIHYAILDKNFSDLSMAFPESNLFFNLSEKGLHLHSLTSNPTQALPDSLSYIFNQRVLEYRMSDNSVTFLPNNNQPSIILKNAIFTFEETDIQEKNWMSALIMQAKWMSQTVHPELAEDEWLSLVRCSFISKIMTPVTSYLVVENEAQKAMLKQKQEQVLASKRSLDINDDTQRMSEPNMLLLLILFGLAWRYKRRMISSNS